MHSTSGACRETFGPRWAVDGVPQNLQQSFTLAPYLHFPHDPARIIHNAMLVSMTDTSDRSKWFMLRFSF